MSRMKVLFVIDSLRQGGAERSSVLTAQSFRKVGWEVEFAIFNPEDQVCREGLDASGVPVRELGWGHPIADALKLKAICDRMKPDIVMFCLYNTALRVRLLRLVRPGTRIVESLVGFEHSARIEQKGYWGFFKQAVRKRIDRITARMAGQHYHAVSNAVADYYQDAFGLNRESIHVIYRGRETPALIDSFDRSRIRDEVFGVRPDDVLIVAVGRQELPKNHFALVKCASLLRERHPSAPIVFAFVGCDGASTMAIRSGIDATGTHSYFRHVGFRHDVVRIIQAADALVLPSFSEGLPGAVIEAMSVGLPVLASDIPQSREVAAGSPGFWFFSPDRPEELANAVLDFVKGRATAQQAAQSSIECFQERYQADAVMDSMRGLVQRLVDGSVGVKEPARQ